MLRVIVGAGQGGGPTLALDRHRTACQAARGSRRDQDHPVHSNGEDQSLQGGPADTSCPSRDARLHLAEAVDAVVNAAGLMSLAPLADFDLAALDRMLRTNIRGTFVVDQEAARRVRPDGAIINFSSSVLGRGPADLHRLRRQQGRRGGDDVHPRARASRPGRHRQRGCPRPDRHRHVPRRQGPGAAGPPGQRRAARTARGPGRHRPRSPPSSPAQKATGSTARPSSSMAESSGMTAGRLMPASRA
jgi:NAD(P)-dependent dehydrogenase (short-subunit alcohol dehydrogenase family)